MNGYRHTHVERVRVLELRAAVRAAIPHLSWRRHGIGVLQAYLREGDGDEVRVHVWHPAVVRPGIRSHGDIHDHRFELQSTVLAGSVGHTEVSVERDDRGAFAVYTVVNARRDIGARYQLQRQGGAAERVAIRMRGGEIPAGHRYTFARERFHRSSVSGLAVTVVTKRDQRDVKARILALADSPPVHAFEAGDPFDPFPVLSLAMDALA